MSWWGKLAGGVFGFMLGGPLGALLGGVLGHNFDKGLAGLEKDGMGASQAEQERIQSAFFAATFSVMGHIAKADGRVSPEEISQAQAIMAEMDLQPDMRRAAIDLFNQGKRRDFPLDDVLDQFRRECRRRTTLIQMFLEIQIQAAWADGKLDTSEEQLLLHICHRLGIPEFLFRQLEQMIRLQMGGAQSSGRRQQPPGNAVPLKEAYAMLGLDSNASNAEIKKAYRRLISQHHPDKLVAKGLPEEMMKVATRKTREIRKAYEAIKKDRGF